MYYFFKSKLKYFLDRFKNINLENKILKILFNSKFKFFIKSFNKFNKNEKQIQKIYLKILDREADEIGLNHYSKRLESGDSIANIEKEIKSSKEYSQTKLEGTWAEFFDIKENINNFDQIIKPLEFLEIKDYKSLKITKKIAGIDPFTMQQLFEIIVSEKPKKILEIGMADGLSTITILKAINYLNSVDKIKRNLTSIDPYQKTQWKNNGLKNIKLLKLQKMHTFINKINYLALPELLKKNRFFDLIFIDGNHAFDYVMHDNFLGYKLLNYNGILINDDYTFSDVKKAMNYFEANYDYLKNFKIRPWPSYYPNAGEQRLFAFKKIKS